LNVKNEAKQYDIERVQARIKIWYPVLAIFLMEGWFYSNLTLK